MPHSSESDSFAGGKYAGRVLEIHSKSPDKDLAKLEAVEHRDSPVRIIVAVDKLKGRLGRQERLRDRLDAGVHLQDPHGADARPRSPPPLRPLHGRRVSGHARGLGARELRQAPEGEESLPGDVHRSSDSRGCDHGPEGERGRTIRNRRGGTSRRRGPGGDRSRRTSRRRSGTGNRDPGRGDGRDLGGSNRQGREFGQGAQGGASAEGRRGSNPRSATSDDHDQEPFLVGGPYRHAAVPLAG